ncbi:hypothetical protein GKKCFE_15165 [Pseudomonas sp. E141]|uniref:hypothetical protein n=1 Tax=Pseudomonas sp. E141 TaxID=2875961 RepID=UPI0040461A43
MASISEMALRREAQGHNLDIQMLRANSFKTCVGNRKERHSNVAPSADHNLIIANNSAHHEIETA